jgi:hypothetical protein
MIAGPGCGGRQEQADGHSVAIFVRKSGAPPQAGEARALSVAPKGEMPAAMVVDTAELTARVVVIDPATRTVTPPGSER